MKNLNDGAVELEKLNSLLPSTKGTLCPLARAVFQNEGEPFALLGSPAAFLIVAEEGSSHLINMKCKKPEMRLKPIWKCLKCS